MSRKHKTYVIANWKMNPSTYGEAKRIFNGIKKTASYLHATRTVICPPSLYLSGLTESYGGHKISFGAQNVFWEREGSYTGEISPGQVASLGGEYVIVGHSERRAMGETNEHVRYKVKSVLEEQLTPVVCVGEKKRSEDGSHLAFVAREIEAVFAHFSEDAAARIILAYEPIWAIGGSAEDAMSAHEMHQMSLFIKKVLRDLVSDDVAESIPILYGGSVEAYNAEDLIRDGHIDGFLVGHASLDPAEFGDILKTADEKY